MFQTTWHTSMQENEARRLLPVSREPGLIPPLPGISPAPGGSGTKNILPDE